MSSPPTSSPPSVDRAADRCVTDPSPQALAPCCRQLTYELCPSTRAILARLSAIHRRTFWRWSLPSRPAQQPRTKRQQLRASARQATTPGRLTPRFDPRAELRPRARRAANSRLQAKRLRLRDQNWLCFFDRYHYMSDSRFLEGPLPGLREQPTGRTTGDERRLVPASQGRPSRPPEQRWRSFPAYNDLASRRPQAWQCLRKEVSAGSLSGVNLGHEPA